MKDETSEAWERRETIEELSDLLRLAEEVAQRLAHESHLESYNEAHQLLDTLHRARMAADAILRNSPAA
jgi:hypothetical protein